MAAIEERDGGALLRREDLAAGADAARAHAGLRRLVPAAAVTGRADVLLVSLGGTAGLREADAELAASLRRAGASVVEALAERPREWRTLRADRAGVGAGGARGGGRGDRRAPPAGGRLLVDHGGAARPARRGRSASTPRPPATAPAATASGSARSSGGGCATRRCWCRGARAGWPRRRSRAPTRSSCPCRSRQRPRRRARHRRDHLRRQSRRRRASTACSPRGRRLGMTARSSSSRASTKRAGGGRRRSAGGRSAERRRARRGPLRGDALARRVPRAPAPRAGVRLRPAAGGLRHRAARGARRRLPARHDALARALRRAAARAPARLAARRRDRRGDPDGARPPVARLRRARRPSCSRRGDPRRSTGWCASSCSRG